MIYNDKNINCDKKMKLNSYSTPFARAPISLLSPADTLTI